MDRYEIDSMHRPGSLRRLTAVFLSIGLGLLVISGSTASLLDLATSTVEGKTAQDSGCVKDEAGRACLPLAPASARVDLAAPAFSHPTSVTNPLFPISQLHSALQMGTVDGKPFRVEITLLPQTKTIVWNGQAVETLVSQFAAYLDGRIEEVALDYFAQADDGSVWYFGEDVFNYKNGVVANTGGSWLAGRDGPAGMIMPANPKAGDVYRPENIPGLVFEEVTVKDVGKTVDGPLGPVEGAVVVRELHYDGGHEEKTFAPGYGEFYTGGGNEYEAMALAVPTDAIPDPPPAALVTLSTGAVDVFSAARAGDWNAASATVGALGAAWDAYRAGPVPQPLAARMSDALGALGTAVEARKPAETGQAAIRVAQTGLDLQLRHRPPVEIDLARFGLTTRQLGLDAAAGDAADVSGDVATLEWMRDRIAQAIAPSTAQQIDTQLAALRTAADRGDLSAATDAAARLADQLGTFNPTH